MVHPTWVGADVDSWGIDHGTRSVLVHAFPDASIPVVQLSIHAFEDVDHHLELGRRLAPLPERGVLIVASGNVVHNLRGMDRKLADDDYDWARRFDEDARERMLTDPTECATLDAHADYREAVPTPDHSTPALYVAGLAGGKQLAPSVVEARAPGIGGRAGVGDDAGLALLGATVQHRVPRHLRRSRLPAGIRAGSPTDRRAP